MKKQSRIILACIIVLALGITASYIAITKNKENDTDSLRVTASYYPLYDFAKHVGGNKIQATNITPAGSEPHDYEPTPRQLVDTLKSDVFIYNGATMEPWADKFLADYTHIAVKANSGISLVEGSEHKEGDATNHEDELSSGAVLDPHFWLDPTLAEKIVDNIKDGLSKASPTNTSYFTSQAKLYKDELAKLDKDYSEGLAHCQTRTIITSHDAFSYLAKRYNLKVESIAGISPDEEPSAAKLAELTDLVRQKNIKYIFFESLVSPKLAETLATETGAKTAVFDPIEGVSDEDQKQGKDYISIQRENLRNLQTALSCQ